MDRILLHVLEHVVHPAHVPFVREPQAAEVHGTGDAGEGRGLLRRRHRARMLAMRQAVQLLQETDRLEVLAPAVLIRDPLSRLARVIEVEHRRDGVHAEAVDVVLLEPEQRVRQQEIADLVAPVIEDQRAQSWCSPCLGSSCSYSAVPSKRARPCASFGKCPGTQSRITPMPAWWQASTKNLKSSGAP